LLSRTLTGIKLDSIGSLRESLRILHNDYGVPHVVVSSIPFDTAHSESWALPPELRKTYTTKGSVFQYTGTSLLCVSSSMSRSGCDKPVVHAAAVPQLAGYYSGVGDLFSAMVLAHFEPPSSADELSSTPLSRAASTALRITQAILRRTTLYASRQPNAEMDNHTDDELDSMDEGRRARRTKARELRLVQSADLILSGGSMGRDAEEGDQDCELKLWKSDIWAM
jgi:pyridoxine kinase